MDIERLFAAVTADPRYQANLDWGEPRAGHPEGTVRAHVAELEGNLERLRPKLSVDECWKLRTLIHVHDTFKANAKEGSPIAGPRSHASLARAFLAEFTDDADLLAMVQFHDDPFALYRQFTYTGSFRQSRLEALLAGILDWSQFSAFLIIDGCTAGKPRTPLEWFFATIEGRVESRFGAGEILL